MSKLDARDRRRAYAVLRNARLPESLVTDGVTVSHVAAALKREREETAMGAMHWFLFNERSTTAKAKRAIAQKYCKRKHVR